ncbi:MAG: single-stranded DNA-binding protein [Pseudolactococcus laudensis]
MYIVENGYLPLVEQAVAQFVLAVNRTFKNANGERETDFINVVIWRQSAENFAKWAKKGALIGVTGRIQTRNYENQQGQRVYVTEVIAENFQMLESRNQQQGQQQAQPQQATQQQAKQPDPFAGGAPTSLNDDDLPF